MIDLDDIIVRRRQGWIIVRRRPPFYSWRYWSGRRFNKGTPFTLFYADRKTAEEELATMNIPSRFVTNVIPAEEVTTSHKGKLASRKIHPQFPP